MSARSQAPEATCTDIAMMRRALELAAAGAKAGEVPVGAVVYRGEQVIAEAHNQREEADDPAGHAELLAIRTAAKLLGSWRLEGCSVAVTLEPCPMCAGVMLNARLPRLIYGAADAKMGAVHTLYQLLNDNRLNHRVEVIPGVLAGECGELLRGFFRERRGQKKDPGAQ